MLGADARTEAAHVTDQRHETAAPEVGEGGDPVCWLSRVCPDCGLFAVREPPTTCQRCGAAIPADDYE
jgi:rubrerythrin